MLGRYCRGGRCRTRIFHVLRQHRTAASFKSGTAISRSQVDLLPARPPISLVQLAPGQPQPARMAGIDARSEIFRNIFQERSGPVYRRYEKIGSSLHGGPGTQEKRFPETLEIIKSGGVRSLHSDGPIGLRQVAGIAFRGDEGRPNITRRFILFGD